MDRVRRRGALVLFTAAAGAYLLDRMTKVWAENALAGDPVDVITGVLTFRFTTNSGGAFSIGQSAPWLFAAATIVVSAIIVATAFRHRSTPTALGLGLILGGALGNLTDRIARGEGLSGRVVDFIDVQVWPIFNVADCAIVVGAVILAVAAMRDDRDRGESERSHASNEGAGSANDA